MITGEWVEIATNSFGMFPQTSVTPGIRPNINERPPRPDFGRPDGGAADMRVPDAGPAPDMALPRTPSSAEWFRNMGS